MSPSASEIPRKFTFVGGPSRKRRRVAPSTPPSSQSMFMVMTTKAATATRPDGVRRVSQSSSTIREKPHTNSSPESNNSDNASVSVSVSENDAARTNITPDRTTFALESQDPPAVVLPPRSEPLGSQLSWQALGDSLEFNDPFSLFGAPFNLPASSDQGLASDIPVGFSTDSSGRHIVQDQDPPITSIGEDIPLEDSSESTEDVERDVVPATEGHGSIPRDLSDNVRTIFAQYDREFCVWPLTHDFEANPFRYDIETGKRSPLLWHSILALSYKHIHRETGSCLTEAKMHKRKAMQLLEELDCDFGSAKSRTNLLNSLLILMTLDCATSAQGPWVAHLSRAQRFLEAIEVFKIQRSPRIQAQVDMLVWWDVTLGLTTRQGFVLSGPTINSVFSWDSTSTFYNVSGCPEQLFKYMFRLGTYAREFELASCMTCVTFDMGPVLVVEKAIKEWRTPRYDGPDVDFAPSSEPDLPENWDCYSAEATHHVQDLHHCAQAWRFALLIYIERVFKWRRGEASMSRIEFFARKVLNNVHSCRRSTMIQKQLLLPVFLAGCETNDENLRAEARDYCSWWGVKTRYDMFTTTLGLLEEVWAAAGDPDSWWGSLIDGKSGLGSTSQYLFG
ncbi:fungal-specific transcription factor domain-containing protein [Trichoderma sp. SZMC 28012]